MRIPLVVELIQKASFTANELASYLVNEMNRNLRDIVSVIRNLDFEDNFQSFTFTGTILANSELAIRNSFRGGIIPTKRIIVRGDTYSLYVVDGVTAWNQSFVSLRNTHASQNATVTVIFLK
jgi:hypothetical protein